MKFRLLLLLLIFFSCNKPKFHYIKFIHIGLEDKPVGTIMICVEKLVHPLDHPSDDFFGKGLKTDMKTFEIMQAFIEENKYSTLKKSSDPDYWITINDKNGRYLKLKDEANFFNGLRAVIKKNNCDKAVIEALEDKAR